MNAVQSPLQETIELFEGNLALLRATLKNEPFPRTTYVVMSGALSLTFDVTDNTAQSPQVCDLNKARRFSKRDAEQVAGQCRNGLGETAQAMSVEQAAFRQIAGLEKCLASLRKANPNA